MLKTRTIGAFLVASSIAAVAFAQNSNPFGGFKHDRTAPIEITSDALEVRQAESLAIFSGNVIAGQGTLRLTADVLEVLYDENNDSGENNENNSETGAIKNMLAKGNVFISNGAETAQGNRAEYDVDTGKINMSGSVVLTQGNNVISGETLVINLDDGQGKVEGRVKSIFTPKSAQNSTAPEKPTCTPEQESAAKAAGLKCVPAE